MLMVVVNVQLLCLKILNKESISPDLQSFKINAVLRITERSAKIQKEGCFRDFVKDYVVSIDIAVRNAMFMMKVMKSGGDLQGNF